MTAVNDFARLVANELDAGQIPWRLHNYLPRNVLFDTVYPDVDPIILQIASTRSGFASPYFGTALEWKVLGQKIIVAPEDGIRIPSSGEIVFSLEQTDRHYEPAPLTYDDPAKVVDNIAKRAGIRIEHGVSADCRWIGGADEHVRLPHKFLFELGPGGPAGYYDAWAHEVAGHWSEARTGWTASYQVNEIRAEIASGYALGWLGIKALPLQLARHHRRFAPGWAKVLRQQPSLLFKVCRNVCRSLDFLFGFADETIPWHDPALENVGSSRVDLQACKLEYSIVSPK